jgi:hypothetical protein
MTPFIGGDAKVTLPEFPVIISGHAYNSKYNMYPLFVYKGITYCPTTSSVLGLLNITATWDGDIGFSLASDDPEKLKLYNDLDTTYMTPKLITASILKTPLKFNGHEIETLEYPLLMYNRAVYIPLTWQLATEELCCSYSFSAAAGLSVQTDTFYNFFTTKTVYARKNGLVISLDLSAYANDVPQSSANLTIEQNGQTQRVGVEGRNYFGYAPGNESGTKFTVNGNWIYTLLSADESGSDSQRCRVNIGTGEIQILR